MTAILLLCLVCALVLFVIAPRPRRHRRACAGEEIYALQNVARLERRMRTLEELLDDRSPGWRRAHDD